MDKAKNKITKRLKRSRSIRKKISGSAQRPRFCVNRSNRFISAQIIDDEAGTTLAHAEINQKTINELAEKKEDTSKSAMAKYVGELIAEKALEKGIKEVVFDRKGFPYHGRIQILADAARKTGLVF